jgi:hypothetical protein
MSCSIKGDLSVMCLTDLLQWGELHHKTGILTVRKKDVEKQIYLEGGKIIFVSSTKVGERLGEYLQRGSHIDLDKIKAALLEAQNMKIPFTQRLLKMNYFTPAVLRDVIEKHAQEILLEAATWAEGTFEFIQGELPSSVLGGPIKLHASEVIQQMCRRLEDSRAGLRKNISYFYIIK